MALQELVDYVQESFADPNDHHRSPPQDETSRPRQPHWLEEVEHGEPTLPRFRRGELPLVDLPEEGFDGGTIRVPRPDHGPDALAYYRPFHFHSRLWGVFVWERGVLYLASILKGGRLLPGDEDHIYRAWNVLVEHERLHFIVEVACSRAELIARSRLYATYFWDETGATREEALANARAYREGLDGAPSQVRKAARRWMKNQGPGYRNFEEYVGDAEFKREQSASIGRFLAPVHVNYSADRLGPVSFLYNRATQLGVPVYLIQDYRTRLFGRGRPFPKDEGMRIKVHTNEHPPPHYHVFIPPEVHRTRYKWPEHKPVDGNPTLSRAEEKKLEEYWRKHGEKIKAKLEKVFSLT